MKALIYARVSSKRQKEQETIEYQLTECQKIVQDNHLTIVSEPVIDNGISGTSLKAREFKNLIDLIESNQLDFDVLVVYSVDRIFREDTQYISTPDAKVNALRKAKVKRSMRDVAEIKSTLITNGIKILEKGSSLQNVSDEIFSIKQTLASSELRKIHQRTMDGQIHNLTDKNLPHMGQLPFGYQIQRNDKGKMQSIIVNQDQAKVLNEIYHSVVSIGPKKTAEMLNEKGTKTPKRNAQWHPAVIYELCKKAEKYYTGTWTYNYQGKSYEITFPPLIDKATFDAISKSAESRRARTDRRVMLSTHTTDCSCKSHIHVCSAGTPPKDYLFCRNCGTYVHYTTFEKAAWLGVVVRLLQIAFTKPSDEVTVSPVAQIKTLKAQLESNSAKISNLATMMLEGLDLSTFRSLNDKLNRERASLESSLLKVRDSLKNQAKRADEKAQMKKQIMAILSEVTKPTTIERKRELLQSILLDKRKLLVTWTAKSTIRITIPAYNGFPEFSYSQDENPFAQIEWSEAATQWLEANALEILKTSTT